MCNKNNFNIILYIILINRKIIKLKLIKQGRLTFSPTTNFT